MSSKVNQNEEIKSYGGGNQEGTPVPSLIGLEVDGNSIPIVKMKHYPLGTIQVVTMELMY